MPRGDRTGPWGEGPMTGRAAGYCAGYDAPGYMNPVYGRGLGFRGGGGWGGGWGGGGRGHRHWFYATGLPRWARWGAGPVYGPYVPMPNREQQAEALEAQAAMLREQLAALEQDIAGLRKESGQGE
jgi:hypothetical protein